MPACCADGLGVVLRVGDLVRTRRVAAANVTALTSAVVWPNDVQQVGSLHFRRRRRRSAALCNLLDAPTARAACYGFDLC